MRKALAIALSICLVYTPLLSYAATPTPFASAAALAPNQDRDQDQGAYQPYTPDQLDNLLGPIALYPDPLLAQILPAATFPDQIGQAAEYVRANGQAGVDEQPWDISVKAVAHYPSIIDMMASRPDWTTALGQAYINQSADISASIQRLRHMAYAQRNLATTPQQDVIVEGSYIEIVPAQPRYIYVPTYNPAVVYVRPVGFGVALAFGAGLVIGAWLNRGWAWGGPGIYYTGWRGGGWIARSRGFVEVNNRVYVNNSYRTVTVNRTVVNRTVNVTNINNYNSVHNNVNFNNRVRVDNRTTNINRVNNNSRTTINNNRTVNRNVENNRINNYNNRNRVNNNTYSRENNTNNRVNNYNNRNRVNNNTYNRENNSNNRVNDNYNRNTNTNNRVNEYNNKTRTFTPQNRPASPQPAPRTYNRQNNRPQSQPRQEVRPSGHENNSRGSKGEKEQPKHPGPGR